MSEIIAAGPGLGAWLLLALALFSVGLFGVLTRKSLVAILISVELMANAVNLNLVAFARFNGTLTGQGFALFSMALTVAEVVVGLALIIVLYRNRRSIEADAADMLHG